MKETVADGRAGSRSCLQLSVDALKFTQGVLLPDLIASEVQEEKLTKPATEHGANDALLHGLRHQRLRQFSRGERVVVVIVVIVVGDEGGHDPEIQGVIGHGPSRIR